MNSPETSIRLVCDIMDFDFFLDLSGDMDSFLHSFIPEMQKLIYGYVKQRFQLTNEGNIMESDEDENGNLK